MTSAAEFQTKVAKFELNMERFDRLVNGAPGTTVVTDSGTYPSIPSVIATFQQQAQAVLQEIRDAAAAP